MADKFVTVYDKQKGWSVMNSDTYQNSLANMKDTAKRIVDRKIPPKFIKKRDGKGGKVFKFVKIDYIEELLTEDYPGWSFEVKSWDIKGKEKSGFIVADVRLLIMDNGMPRYIDDIGGAEIKYYGGDHPTRAGDYLDLANDVKAAVTDGFKRCAYRLGYIRELKYEAADLNITEEQWTTILDAIDKLKEINIKKYEKIKEVVYQKVNRANFNAFMRDKILDAITRKIDPDKYEIYIQTFGVSKPKGETK